MKRHQFCAFLIGLAGGVLAMAQTPGFSVTDLGPVGPNGQPFSVSNNSLVTGVALTGAGYHSILWYKGQMMDVGKFGFGGQNSIGSGVNVKAQVAGAAETSVPDPYGEDFCGFATHMICLPFLWQNGLMLPLPTLGGRNGAAFEINNLGDAVGFAENTRSDSACAHPQLYEFKPVLWKNGQAQELPTYPGDTVGLAHGINDNDQVVGSSGVCTTFNPIFSANIQPLHALLWQSGKLTDLGNLGGTGNGGGNVPWAVNNKGQVVGNSDLRKDETFHAFLWQQPGPMTDLGTLPGDVASAAIAINDTGDVVGLSLDKDFNPRPFLWRNGVMHSLNDLVPPDSPLYLLLACSINIRGEIIGLAVDKSSGDVRGYLLTPVAGSSAGGSISPALRTMTSPTGLSEDARKRLPQQFRFSRPEVRMAESQ